MGIALDAGLRKRVAFYSRSSKDAHDVSCDSQFREFESLAEKAGEIVVERRSESAVSHFDAQGFMELINLAKQKPRPFDKVYVWDTSRISRDQITQAVLIREMERAGVEVFFVKLPTTNNEMVNMLLRAIYGVFDQLHSMKSAQDAKRGMKENIMQGYRAGGPAPYGYRLIHTEKGTNKRGEPISKSRLEPDPEKAAVVKEVFQRVADGESRGAIARDFTERGVPRSRGGTRWDTNAVTLILNNSDAYLGKATWNRSGDRERRRRNPNAEKVRPETEWVVNENAHEPIISEELAQRVQARRRRYARKSPHVVSSNLLEDLAWCEHCEKRLQGWGHNRLACSQAMRGVSDCNLTSVSQEAIIYAVLEMILERIGSVENIERLVDRIVDLSEEGSDYSVLESRLGKICRNITKWELVIDELGESLDAIRLTHERLRPLYEERDELMRELEEAQAEKPVRISRESAYEALKLLRVELNKLDIASSQEEVVNLLKMFVVRIYVCQKEKRGSKTAHLKILWNPVLINKKSLESGSIVGIGGSGTGNRTPVTWLRTTRPNH
jgi:DNA invertase Pin-like site-specific DNA recombinase